MKFGTMTAFALCIFTVAWTQEPPLDTMRQKIGTTNVLASEYTVLKGTQQRHGFYKTYHPNGQLAYLGQYQKGQMVGTWNAFFANGKPWKVTNYLAGMEEGTSKEWDEQTGNLISERNYHQGEPEGTQKTFDASGRPELEETWKDGRYHGPLKTWENGIMTRELHYEEGKLHGTIRSWHPNGKLRIEMQFVKGLPQGWSREWNVAGDLIIEGEFSKGERHGIQRKFEDGKMVSEQIWENNECKTGCETTTTPQ